MNDAMTDFKKGFHGGETPSEPEQLAEDAANTVPAANVAAEGDTRQPPEVAAEPPMTPEEQHKEAAWMGRLRKKEEELAARAAELDARESTLTQPTDEPESAAEKAMETPADEMAEESGDFSTLKRQMADELGGEFAELIAKMIHAAVKQGESSDARYSALRGTIDGLIGELRNTFGTMHRDTITDQFPDVEEILDSPEFQAFCAGYADPAKCQDILDNGNARQIIGLLKEFRASLPVSDPKTTDAIDEAAMKAAAGVRSNPVSPAMGESSPADPMEAFRKGFNKGFSRK